MCRGEIGAACKAKVRRNVEKRKINLQKRGRQCDGLFGFLLNAPTGPRIVCLESESDDATSPDGPSVGDFLIHKPGVG